MRRLIVIIAICAGVLWGGPAAAAADDADAADAADAAVFDRAWAAFKRGDLAKAWDGFDVAARNFLGSMYEDGVVVSRDHGEAVKWYRRAAELGLAEAQVNLGFRYVKGQGVARGLVRAHMWSNLAAAQGAEMAMDNRAIVAATMTPDQIAEVQGLARE